MEVFETRESIAESASAEELRGIQARLQGEMDRHMRSFGHCIAARETKGAMSAAVRLKYFSKVSPPPPARACPSSCLTWAASLPADAGGGGRAAGLGHRGVSGPERLPVDDYYCTVNVYMYLDNMRIGSQIFHFGLLPV